MVIRNLREDESLPHWVDTFGYEPQWTWVYEEEKEIQAIGIGALVFGKLFLLRLQAHEPIFKNWIFPFFRKVAQDCITRGVEDFYFFHQEDERVKVIFERKGCKDSMEMKMTLGSWRNWL